MLFNDPAFDFSIDSLVKDSLLEKLRSSAVCVRTRVSLESILAEEHESPVMNSSSAEFQHDIKHNLGRGK